MTDEALFYRQFVEDVRRCAADRGTASVAEIERRVRVAMTSEPSVRERRWARVVAAVNDLLLRARNDDPAAVGRLRAFVRENADLGRVRDVSLSDFRFTGRPEKVITASDGRRYLVFASLERVPKPPFTALAETVPSATRRATSWAVYALCAGAALGALWFSFVMPV